MRIDAITLFPEFLLSASRIGVIGRAQDRGLLEVNAWNPRDYASDKHRTVDDRPYGGGPGMLMMVAPLKLAIDAAKAASNDVARVIYLSPQGARLTQRRVQQLAVMPSLVLICGRYEGVDERLIQAEVDEELSIGDYVLSGGELPAAVLIDAIARLQEGALGDADSAAQDSFSQGLLDCPHYSRPEVLNGASVPQVLLSGDHAAIKRWRLKQSLGKTWLQRPDLLAHCALGKTEKQLLEEFRQEYLANLENQAE